MYTKYVKHILEVFLSIILIILLLPVFIIISILIKMTSSGPVFFKQNRIGQYNKTFKMYKFRTMIDNAEQYTGPTFTTENDTRITTLGKILRKYHLDELPQLFNVIKRDMNLIGPRPERTEFVNIYNKNIENYQNRHQIKPGITGYAQINYPYAASLEQTIDKLHFDLFYINNSSFLLDIQIYYKTFIKILKTS